MSGAGFVFGHGPAAAQLPAVLGPQLSAASLCVTFATDATGFPVTQSGTWNVNATVQNATLAVTQSGNWSQRLQDGSGNLITSTASALDVNVKNASMAVTQSGTWSVRNQDGSGNALASTSGALNVSVQNASLAVTAAQLPATLGQHLSAASMSVVIAADQSAVPVSQSGTWTVSSTQLPASLGQKTMANSQAVVLASDQSAISVTGSTSLTGVDYNAGVTGATTQRVVEAGRTSAWKARYDYTGTPVTNSAYTQVAASTAAACTRIRIFDSSGAALVLATGVALSEVDQMYIPPGGFDSVVELYIPAGTRVSVKSVDTASVSVGQLLITALS